MKESGTGLIAKERQRQIEKEGYSPHHDDEHKGGELSFHQTTVMPG